MYAREIPNTSSESLGGFIRDHIALSAHINTDKWSGYAPFEKSFENLVRPTGRKGGNFPEMHRVIMNLKGWLKGVHHHVEHLQDYLDEYCYRFNRSFMKEGIFENLMLRMVKAEPCYIKSTNT